MNIEIRCNKCSRLLTILYTSMVPGMDAMRMDVTSCGSADCANCTDCEDAELLEKAKQEITELTLKLLKKGQPQE